MKIDDFEEVSRVRKELLRFTEAKRYAEGGWTNIAASVSSGKNEFDLVDLLGGWPVRNALKPLLDAEIAQRVAKLRMLGVEIQEPQS